MAKPTIVTRAGKGSALTWTEGDDNFTNLQTAAVPDGGAAGDMLVKNSATDWDFGWTDRVNAKTIFENVKNVSGGTLTKGTPVTQVGITGMTITVAAARADDPDLLAIGVLDETLADEAEGRMTVLGEIKGVNTSGFTTGDQVYLGATGGYTNVKPTATDVAVQFLGIVNRVDASNGSGFITGTLVEDAVRYTGTAFEFWDGTGWVELSGGGGLTELADDLSPTLGGNLDVSTYSIISSSNGDITIDPNGTGEIVLIGSTVVESNRISNGGAGPGAFLIQGTSQNIEFSAADQTIIFTGAAGIVGSTSLVLSSNGFVVNSNNHDLTLQSNTVKVGNNNFNATLTTRGTSDLILNTNGGTNSGNITILDGANQNITLTPNGTGVVAVSSTLTAGRVAVATNTYSSTSSISLQQAHTTADANNINFARSRGTNASPAAVQTNDELFELVALGHDGSNYVTALDITTTTIGTPSTGFVPSKTEFKVRTNSSTVETVLELASDLGGAVAVNGVTNIGAEVLAIEGSSGVSIQGLVYPAADGSNGQVLSTNGSGVLSWVTPGGGTNLILLRSTSGIVMPAASNTVGTFTWTVVDSGGVSGVTGNSNGTFTLPAGTYVLTIPQLYSNSTTLADFRLRCTTDSTNVFDFGNSASITLDGTTRRTVGEFTQKFTISTSKTFGFVQVNTTAFEMYSFVGATSSSNSTYSQSSNGLVMLRLLKVA